MIRVKSGTEILNTYQRLRMTAESVDQSHLDTDRRDDYVSFELHDKLSVGGAEHDVRRVIHSRPETVVNSSQPDPLVQSETKTQNLFIAEREYMPTYDGGVAFYSEFTDNGSRVRVKESAISHAPDGTLQTEEQQYIIFKKSGKVKALKS